MMDKMAEQERKKIKEIEILHLDKVGYGPEGKHTRREWRKECSDNLIASIEQFEAWQETWQDKVKTAPRQSYGYVIYYEDGSQKNVSVANSSFFSFDFIAQTFEVNHSFKEFKFVILADFRCAKFEGDADFGYAKFEDGADFTYAKFEESSKFNNCTFKKTALFNKTKFEDDVSFRSADFNARAEFVSLNFNGRADFLSASFKSQVSFRNANFTGVALFINVNFRSDATFHYAKFYAEVRFHSARFNEISSFEDVLFENVGHFEGALFFKKDPCFLGCRIDNTRLEFDEDMHFPIDDFTRSAITNISFLKRLSDEHGQTDQALNFNAMDLRAKRKLEFQNLSPVKHKDAIALLNLPSWRVWLWVNNFFKGKFWFCVFTYLYELCSDFGRSFTRPLFILITLNIITITVCLFVASQQMHSNQSIFSTLTKELQFEGSNKISLSAFRAATEYSLYKTGNFFDFSDADKRTEIINQRLFGSAIEPSFIRVYGFLKGLFSAVLIFLIGLGVRNKYRVS